MTEADCARVLALWGLTDIEQAVDCPTWPWWKSEVEDGGAVGLVIAKRARIPNFTADDAAAVKLAEKMGALMQPFDISPPWEPKVRPWRVARGEAGEHQSRIYSFGDTLGNALLAALESIGGGS